MVVVLGEANQPYPESSPNESRKRQSEWLPAEWVESALEPSGSSAEIIEIQPGVRWAPSETSQSTQVAVGEPPDHTPAALAPRRSSELPRLRLPRISGPDWIQRRHLQAAAAVAFILGTPAVLGSLNAGLTGNALPPAQSPFHPALIAAPPGPPGATGGGVRQADVIGHSAGGLPVVRTAGPAAAAPGSASRSVSGSTQAGGGTTSSPHSSSIPTPASTPQPPGSGTGNSGSPHGGKGGGGQSPPENPPPSGSGNPSPANGNGGDSSPSPVSQVTGVVTSAPATVQGVASSATSNVPVP